LTETLPWRLRVVKKEPARRRYNPGVPRVTREPCTSPDPRNGVNMQYIEKNLLDGRYVIEPAADRLGDCAVTGPWLFAAQ
jgi:hypothetical protein